MGRDVFPITPSEGASRREPRRRRGAERIRIRPGLQALCVLASLRWLELPIGKNTTRLVRATLAPSNVSDLFTISISEEQLSPHISHGPANAVEQVLLEPLVLPDLFPMAKGCIEDPSAAKGSCPGQREVAVRAVHPWDVQID